MKRTLILVAVIALFMLTACEQDGNKPYWIVHSVGGSFSYGSFICTGSTWDGTYLTYYFGDSFWVRFKLVYPKVDDPEDISPEEDREKR